ncbi:piggyBac transposable element-derived protein 4-like [Amphiura filiformis]|uniref:piggyBac transposable element-derived protein 4-like n=1 Tax=Amphiura filiformis TaxID=82378 RepID=UPI003B223229
MKDNVLIWLDAKKTTLRFNKFRGGETGPAFNAPDMEPVDIFLRFFTLTILRKIVMWTNVALLAAGLPSTNLEEIKAFFGIFLLMGVVRINAIHHYWSTKAGLRNIVTSQTMRRDRFYKVSRYLQCSDPADNPDDWPRTTNDEKQHYYNYTQKHPLYPLQEVWDKVLENCNDNFKPGRNLAIDEAMVRYKGFTAVVKKFFMPSKPIRSGYKIYALCDSGTAYMLNFMVHPQHKSTMYKISKSVIRPVFGKFHHIFCDMLYTSVDLARKLLTKKTYITGAIMANRKELPEQLSTDVTKNRKAKSIKEMNKTPCGTMYFRQNADLTYCMWRDKKILITECAVYWTPGISRQGT